MNRLKQLQIFTTRELADELKRRMDELEEARSVLDRFTAVNPPGTSSRRSSGTYPGKSAAKAEYWNGWHTYKASHPDASVDEWRKWEKSQRSRKK